MEKYGDNLAFDWSGQWCNADDGVQDVAAPGPGDNANLTFNSVAVALTADTLHFDKFDASMFTGTVAMAGYSIDCNASYCWLGGTFTGDVGAKIYSSVDFIATAGMSFDPDIEIVLDAAGGSSNITTNGVTIGDLTIGGGAEFTLGDALSCGSISLASGTLNLSDQAVTMTAGSTITQTGGALTSPTDYGATIDAAGAVISGITASKWINVTNGIDGGGNAKLAGLIPMLPPLGGSAGGAILSARR